jgi:hypothetical protein
MLRAPVSRMDILTPDEIKAINESSVLVQKYSHTIDRESAYEILGRKITTIQNAEAVGRERERGRGGEGERRTSGGTTYRRGSQTPQGKVVKVLTSATFIRGVFGILKKVMR